MVVCEFGLMSMPLAIEEEEEEEEDRGGHGAYQLGECNLKFKKKQRDDSTTTMQQYDKIYPSIWV